MKKDLSQYHKEYYGEKKRNRGFFIALGFLIVVLIISLFVFSGYFSLTGNVVDDLNEDNSISINLNTNIPDISLKGKYAKININPLKSNSSIILDGKKISTLKTDSFLLENFSGKIEINSKNISLDGKINKIFLNGALLENEDGKPMEINSKGEIDYSKIDFIEDIYIRKLSYSASGSIQTNEQGINLQDSETVIKNLQGKFILSKSRLNFEGRVTNLKVKNEGKNIIISK